MASLQSIATRTSSRVVPSAARRHSSSLGVKRAACAPNMHTADRRGQSTVVRAAGEDVLYAGQSLESNSNGTIFSKNGAYRLVQQQDGNLVIYTSDNTPIWANARNGSGAVRSIMQDDGNFVSYTGDGRPVWATNTWGNGQYCRVIMQNDANLVIYKPIWAIRQ